MDIATLVGIITAVGAISWAMYEGTEGHLSTFYSSEGFVLVLGGSLAAVCLSMPAKAILEVFGYLKKWLFSSEVGAEHLIQELVRCAELARREGMLALENEVKKQTDPFMRRGLQLAVDGMDDATIDQTLRIEIDALGERHKKGKKFFELMSKYGPGFGLTATLIGQICMFKNMGGEGGDSGAIGKALAVALLGTLYGCLICNVICGPIADKLAIRSTEELHIKELVLTGIKSIQAGDNPRIVAMKLQSFLSQGKRQAFEQEKKE